MASRKEETLSNKNVFAALSSFKKKKKSDKDKNGSSKKPESENKGSEKEVFWVPAPLTVKSWADVDDDDDDDYYATTTAPTVSVWGSETVDSNLEKDESEAVLEESESEVEGLDEVDDDVGETHEPEEPPALESVIKKPPETPAQKESERQLSKKELKKKELEELDAVLAELGYPKQESSSQTDSHDVMQGKKTENNGEVEKKDSVPGESKSSKKKKKKDKTSKEAKESQEQPRDDEDGNGVQETADGEQADDVSTVDVKDRLKKVASMKKKKPSRETDAAARAAASEAAARNAKLAAAKKKEKNHYNQQPVR